MLESVSHWEETPAEFTLEEAIAGAPWRSK